MSTSQKRKTKESDITSLSTNDAAVLARAYLQAAMKEYESLLGGTLQDCKRSYRAFAEQISTIAGRHGIEIGSPGPLDNAPKAKNYVDSMLKQPYTENIKNLLQQVRSVLDEKKTPTPQVPLKVAEGFLLELDNVTRKGLSEEQRQFRQDLESSVTPSSAAKEKEKDKDSAHRTVYSQPFSAELLCPNWHLHNKGFQRAVDEGTNTGFSGVFCTPETRFNDRMKIPLLKACGDAKVDVKSHASFEADTAVVADYVVRLMSNLDFYPLLLELKTDDSEPTQDAAKAQVLEYASRAIKSAGPEWRDLKGYLFPFAITVCGQNVSVYACTLGDEVHGKEAFPSVLHTKLCDTKLEKLGNVIAWLLDEEHMAHYENISAIAQGKGSGLTSIPEHGDNRDSSAASGGASDNSNSGNGGTNDSADGGVQNEEERDKAATQTDTADNGKEGHQRQQLAVTKAARARSAKVATRYEMCVYKGDEDTVTVALVNGEVLKVCGGHEIGAAKEASNEREGWELVYPEETVKVHERSRPVFACPDLSNHITGAGTDGKKALHGTGIKDEAGLAAAAEYLLRLSKRDLCHRDIRSHNILRNGCIVDFGFLCKARSRDEAQTPPSSLPESYSTRLRERPRKWLLHHDAEAIPAKVVLDWESLLFAYVFSSTSLSDAMYRLLEGKAFLLQWLEAKLTKLDKDEKKETAALQDKSDDDKKKETAALQDKLDKDDKKKETAALQDKSDDDKKKETAALQDKLDKDDKKKETAALQDKSDDDKKKETAALLRNIMQHIACAYF
ncbi:kinase subdomain-containing protein [Salpingoeca rosetta]|uniref:Kinase subdomain-containing protein n=1 Tax=Salpingoeca rosetta (strain ATCC 50818 / BSB-021) TaxID=946362 RepID=F2U4A2_SALR5|nr:kinase subdomain-containing protein [Salpingoeca rosetta]EGD82468.1 kinase subdomain-containing protein [Salpingoeca rosetta]|eukprot:XP_004995704.1 kinase subdomain-containing protein [Salpingoeca rosetta]